MNDENKIPVRILLTPAGGVGILPELRSLVESKKYDPYIVLADSNSAVASFFLPEVHARYHIPQCGDSHYIDSLTKLIEREKIQYHYSGLDEELPVLASNKDRLTNIGCYSLLPDAGPLRSVLDKYAMWECLRETIRMPTTFLLSEDANRDYIYRELKGDVMFKATSLRGGRGVNLARTRPEFDFYFSQCSQKSIKDGNRFIAQSYIVGDEYNVSTLHDKAGREIFAISRRKFEDRIVKSTTTAAVIEYREDVIELARMAIHESGLAIGFNNVEIIVDNNEDKPYLIEINGGRTAAQDLNLVASGINLTDLLLDILRGEEVAQIPHPPGGTVSLQFRTYLTTQYSQIEGIAKI